MSAGRLVSAGVLARTVCLAGLASLAVGSGCAATHDGEPAALPRSLELERLGMLVGRWESTAESVLEDTGEVLHVSSTVAADWALGGEFLITKARFLIEGGEGVSAWESETADVGVFTWDAEARIYRVWHFDDGGMFATGTMEYEATTRTWRVSEESVDRRTGTRVRGEGTMRYVAADERLTEWTSTPLSGQGGGFTSRGHSMRTASRP